MAKAKAPEAVAPPVAEAPAPAAPVAASSGAPATVTEAMAAIQAGRLAAGQPQFINGEELEAAARHQFPDLLNP